jgi:hypothetical protein
MTIYEKAVQQMKREEIDNHCSDLYLKKNAISNKLVDEYEFKQNVKTFKDNITHTTWYDIPFAYDPFWEEKCSK